MNCAGAAAEFLISAADAVLARREASEPMLALGQGRIPRALGSVAASQVHADAAFYANWRDHLQELTPETLSPMQRALLRALQADLNQRSEAAQYHELDFVLTPYRGGDLHVEAREAFAAHPLTNNAEREAYLDLLRDYARLLDEMFDHTSSQAARGQRLAAAAVPLARSTLTDLAQGLRSMVTPQMARLEMTDGAARSAFLTRVTRLSEAELEPRIQRLRAMLDDDYVARAPQVVGLHQYARGAEFYAFLIRQRADSVLAPQEIHQIGLEEIAELQATKATLRAQLASGATAECFDRALRHDARWKARTPLEVERCFLGHMERITPLLSSWFGRLPKAGWAVTRADPSVERGMSYGYYQAPTPLDPVGRYRYNGREVEKRTLIGAAHLIYHELMPGHHLQIAMQRESPAAHPLQRHLPSMAAVEGWAVYASELAREMGAVRGYDLYGHCAMQSWTAARLVVDTGLNALGWSLARARDFMVEHTMETPAVIDAELLRYATDIPAQALAYNLGKRRILGERERARSALGRSFDIRAFHDAALEVGGLPLPVLASRVDDLIAETPG